MKNFIWDFDGTLFNSYPHISKAFCMMLDNHNREYDEKEVTDALLVNFQYAFDKYSLTESEIKEFRAYTDTVELKPEIMPYPDAEKILKYVAGHNGVNYIYTHRNTDTLVFYLKRYDMLKYFKAYVTSDYGFQKKPSPDGIEYIIKEYQLDKNATIMIGDREIDALSGKNADIYGGLVKRDGRLENTKADYVFKTLDDVMTLI